MGMLEDIMGKMSGQAPGAGAGGGQGALIQAVLGMLGGGGLQSILQSFDSNGLGQILQSWIGTGANQPVSPDQVRQGLGDDRIAQLSQQTGMDQSALTAQLSQLLPGLVDKLTPDGKVPEGNSLDQGLGALRGLFR